MAKKGAVAAAVVGIGALGLGAVALMRSSNETTQKKDADSMFSGLVGGGGATGNYSDTTGVINGILNDVLQTQPQTQTPIIITPPNSGTDDLLPLINAFDNPSDERSDIRQEGTFEDFVSISQAYSGTPQYLPMLQSAGFNISHSTDGKSTAEKLLIQSLDSQSATAVEYSPFSFAPTPKQQDISSYNIGKAGGATANTPAKNTDAGNTDSKPTITGTRTTNQKSASYSVAESNPVQTALQATSSFVGGVTSAVGGFFGNLFGGK